MARNIDSLLGELRAVSTDRILDDLESGVWARIEAERRDRALPGGGVRVQLAVATAALAMGVVFGGLVTERQPGRSEMVVLSEDAGLAPSVAIEGGA